MPKRKSVPSVSSVLSITFPFFSHRLQKHPNWQEDMLKQEEAVISSVPVGAAEKFVHPDSHLDLSRTFSTTSAQASSGGQAYIGGESSEHRHESQVADLNSQPAVVWLDNI